jgi:DNA-directed RNA polymerase I subunit RPA2
MAPAPIHPRAQPSWSVEFDTVRREKLFKNPPKDRSAYPRLREAVRPHVDSFNAIFENQNLLESAIKDIGTRTFLEPDYILQQRAAADQRGSTRHRLHVRVKEIIVEKARIPDSNKNAVHNRLIYPAECRERHASYRGKLRAKLDFRINNGNWHTCTRELGQLPIMLRSNKCHLQHLSPAELVRCKEETEEQGGYFIVNGNEKLIRMLIVAKRNYPMAITRTAFENRGSSYSHFGVQIRCVRPDETSQTNVLHYLKDGNVTFRFSWKKNEYLIPVMMILKALVETNDREIFQGLAGPEGSKGLQNTFVTERAELLLRTYKTVYNLHGKNSTRAYLGERFKHVLDIPADAPDIAAGTEFLRKIVLVHLGNVDVTDSQDRDKFNLLLFMIRKLYTYVAGDCKSRSALGWVPVRCHYQGKD